MLLSEEQDESKSETSQESAEQNNAGVKSYNEKCKNLFIIEFILVLM